MSRSSSPNHAETNVYGIKSLLVVLTAATLATAIFCSALVWRVHQRIDEFHERVDDLEARIEKLQDWWEIDRTNQNAEIEALKLYVERMLDEDD